MNYSSFDKVLRGNCFNNFFAVLMPLIMKSDGFTIVVVNSGTCDNRSTQIAADIFNDILDFTFGFWRINIKPILRGLVDFSFNLFEIIT